MLRPRSFPLSTSCTISFCCSRERERSMNAPLLYFNTTSCGLITPESCIENLAPGLVPKIPSVSHIGDHLDTVPDSSSAYKAPDELNWYHFGGFGNVLATSLSSWHECPLLEKLYHRESLRIRKMNRKLAIVMGFRWDYL